MVIVCSSTVLIRGPKYQYRYPVGRELCVRNRERERERERGRERETERERGRGRERKERERGQRWK